MGAYKCDVVVLIKTGPYIHGCLFCVVAYYPDITVYRNCLPNTSLLNKKCAAEIRWSMKSKNKSTKFEHHV